LIPDSDIRILLNHRIRKKSMWTEKTRNKLLHPGWHGFASYFLFNNWCYAAGRKSGVPLSFLRKQESAVFLMKIWIPAFAGMTECVTWVNNSRKASKAWHFRDRIIL